MIQQCVVCASDFNNPQKVKTCSRECCTKLRQSKAQVLLINCHVCSKAVVLTGRAATAPKARGRAYCSPECREAFMTEHRSKTMAETNRKYASARMKQKNPMFKDQHRERMKQTLKEIGHKPPVQGGNGRGLTVPQRMLSEALGWETEIAIKTPGMKWHALKVDMGHRGAKIAVEVDGASHGALKRQQQDREKTAALESLGWIVLRFSNAQVMDDLEACVQTVMSTISKSQTCIPISQMAS